MVAVEAGGIVVVNLGAKNGADTGVVMVVHREAMVGVMVELLVVMVVELVVMVELRVVMTLLRVVEHGLKYNLFHP